ncbi:UNVERIFIED_CONTAM: putative enzymatic polyprotein [Sesamum latifolium]|uniref:Enzymatic polyprotein n=1 Tax=Sesamum latifolium TaxID=2727402 RepID=A0AAW2YBY3_9LAMI
MVKILHGPTQPFSKEKKNKRDEETPSPNFSTRECGEAHTLHRSPWENSSKEKQNGTSSTPEGKGDESSKAKNQRRADPRGYQRHKIMEIIRADLSDLQELAESFSQLGIVELVNVQTNEITPALPPPVGSTGSNDPPQDHPMRESTDFHTNATPTFLGTRLRENPERNPRRVPEHTPWARTMLQSLHPNGTILNLDIIDFKNTEKLIDEWVATLKIAATTLELDRKRNYSGREEWSSNRSSRSNVLCKDLQSMEGNVDPVIVPEGQLDSVARRMSFLKNKLKDWCYQASIQKNMKRLRGKDHGGPNPRPEPTNLDRGPDQQGLHPKDLDEQILDPQDEPLQEELSDGPIPEPMKVSKTAIAGPAEQRVTYLQIARINVVNCKFEATNDILDAVYYGDLSNYNEGDRLQTSESLSGFFSRMTVSNKTIKRIMRQDSNLSPYDGFRIGGIGRVLNQIGLNQGDITSSTKYVQQPVIGRYEGMLEIAGHEILVAGVAGKENRIMTLGLKFLEDHKPWGRKGADILLGNNFIQTFAKYVQNNKKNLLIFTTNCGNEIQRLIKEIINIKEALQEIKSLNISEESKLSLENVKRLIQRNFSENPLAWWDRNKIKATLKVKEECKYEYVRYKPIQINMEDKKDMQTIIKEHINLGLIEPGVSAYSSPGFLVRNHGEIKRGKPREGLVLSEKKATIAVNKIEFLEILIDETGIELQEHIMEKIRNFPDVLKVKKKLQSFLGVVNFASIFIKDLAKNRKDFGPLLKETESSKWKWEEIHTQRIQELKQVCSNLPKLAIHQDEDKLVVYTYANDYRWAAVLMKKSTTGEEPCRYTGGLFSVQQAQVWHVNEKEFFAVWKAFKKWPLFLLAREFTLKIDNTNIKAFLTNKLESKIEKAQMEEFEANSVMLRLRHLRENLEELDREFGRLAVNAQVAGQVQRADLDIVQTTIRSSLVASTALWNAL